MSIVCLFEFFDVLDSAKGDTQCSVHLTQLHRFELVRYPVAHQSNQKIRACEAGRLDDRRSDLMKLFIIGINCSKKGKNTLNCKSNESNFHGEQDQVK